MKAEVMKSVAFQLLGTGDDAQALELIRFSANRLSMAVVDGKELSKLAWKDELRVRDVAALEMMMHAQAVQLKRSGRWKSN
jgi:hypothetical protein